MRLDSNTVNVLNDFKKYCENQQTPTETGMLKQFLKVEKKGGRKYLTLKKESDLSLKEKFLKFFGCGACGLRNIKEFLKKDLQVRTITDQTEGSDIREMKINTIFSVYREFNRKVDRFNSHLTLFSRISSFSQKDISNGLLSMGITDGYQKKQIRNTVNEFQDDAELKKFTENALKVFKNRTMKDEDIVSIIEALAHCKTDQKWGNVVKNAMEAIGERDMTGQSIASIIRDLARVY